MHFRRGVNYVAGFDKPAIVSIERIRRGVAAKGFAVVGAWPCSDFPGLPFAAPGRCGDGWDWIALVSRTGPDAWIEVPDRVHWLVAVPPANAPPPQLAVPGQVPPPPQPTGPTLMARRSSGLDVRKVAHVGAELAGLVVVAPLLWWSGGKLRGGGRAAVRAVAAATALVDAALLVGHAID